jgi:hypothetical protein
MEPKKKWWSSQTVWSGAAGLLASIGGAFAAWQTRDLAGFGTAITTAAASIGAISGRFKASQPLGL